MKSRSSFRWGRLLLLLLAIGCSSTTKRSEEIDQEALSSIDDEKLEKQVADFIDLALQHRTIDQPATRFRDLWAFAMSKEAWGRDDKFDLHMFILPCTEKTRRHLESEHGASCWPMLDVFVERDSQTIQRVIIYLQCL